jgi:hypothetical protein
MDLLRSPVFQRINPLNAALNDRHRKCRETEAEKRGRRCDRPGQSWTS